MSHRFGQSNELQPVWTNSIFVAVLVFWGPQLVKDGTCLLYWGNLACEGVFGM